MQRRPQRGEGGGGGAHSSNLSAKSCAVGKKGKGEAG